MRRRCWEPANSGAKTVGAGHTSAWPESFLHVNDSRILRFEINGLDADPLPRRKLARYLLYVL
jgi:hypothetical protein